MSTANLLYLATALLATATPAKADSDGNFCVGLDYVAVEFSSSKEPGNHRLYVLRVDDGEGWRQPRIIELPPFQTHAMRCDARSVTLAGWDSVHTVTRGIGEVALWDLETAAKPPGPPDPTAFPALTASIFGRGQIVPLFGGATGRSHEFRVTRVPAEPCRVRVTVSVVQMDGGEDVAAYELFNGIAPTECGE